MLQNLVIPKISLFRVSVVLGQLNLMALHRRRGGQQKDVAHPTST